MRYMVAVAALGLLVVVGCDSGETIKIEPLRFTDAWDIIKARYPEGDLTEPGLGVVEFHSTEDDRDFKITVREVSRTKVNVTVKSLSAVRGGKDKVAEQQILRPIMAAIVKQYDAIKIVKPKGLD